MQTLYDAERSPIAKTVAASLYQPFGQGKKFLKDATTDIESQIQKSAIVDLTNLSRVGFRGADAATYLNSFGFHLPDAPNFALQQADGSWVACLSATEYFLLGSLIDFGERISQIENDWTMDDRANYLLPRQDSHAWLQLTGNTVARVMAKVCAVDLSSEVFAVGQVVQTSVARVNAIVINVSDAQIQKFNILCDRAAALYVWEVLQDAIAEFDGKAVGIEGLL
ncbi:sarcosine oxidase [Acinetobacter pittii]|uniref:sarcosine oxidase subunit gamma n=1 Tax=Acinetobacter pittii TaxID=48296 RepID=UPI001EFCFB70|nr:sarcosine oxidase subunit gamma family protein [Acinetobacter pittii]MCG9494191.1 sarcosine oxidase [Acinetobacter pittii]